MPEAQIQETTSTPTSSTPLPNSDDARTPEGTIKDQGAPVSAEPEARSAPAVPEAYADFTLPKDMSIDPKVMDGAKAMFKELGLSQEAAQKLISFQADREQAFRAANTRAMEDMRAEWRDKAAKDPVIGPKLDTDVKEQIGKALGLLDPKVVADFKEQMNITGYGDNPALIRAFYDLALKVNEGKHVSGTGPSEPGQQRPGSTSRPSPAGALFPNLPSGARAL